MIGLFVGAGVRRILEGALAVALVAGSGFAAAEMVATPLRGDSRLVEFIFDKDNTFLVLTKPRAVTHVQFAPDEVIVSIAAGDTSTWQFTRTKNGRHLFVKPTYEDAETSLTVLTTKRSYQFVLRSTGDGKKWYQRVSWLYNNDLELAVDEDPEGQTQVPMTASAQGNPVALAASPAAASVDPETLRFGYEVTGNAPFRPRVVFDDGRFTYFKMPQQLQELPALFAVIEDKDYSLVNFEVKGDYLVAQRLLTTAVLKLGKAEVRVIKAAPKRSFFGFSSEAP